jgi:hypothetical protein
MKRSTLLLAVATLGLTFAASASDSDPGGGDRRSWYGGRDYGPPVLGVSGIKPLYYRPTMRYYGNGYTVNYRYVPVYLYEAMNGSAVGSASNFRTEAFHIATDDIPSWGATAPRLTVKDARSAPPRTAITTIIRKTSSGKKSGKAAPVDAVPADAPAITPAPAFAPAPAAAPAPDAAPAQPKP